MKTAISYPMFVFILPVIFWLFVGAPPSVSAQEVQADLQPETFSIDETATLQITVQNAQNAEIVIPEIDGLIFHHRGKSSQVQIVNGSVTSSAVYSYIIEPVKEGRYEIPPIKVDLGGKTLQTKPLTCNVSASSGNQHRQPGVETGRSTAASSSFISFIPQKEKIYRGQVIPATIKVYFKKGIRVNQISLPRLLGERVLLDELSNNPHQTEEVLDNVAYSVLAWDTFVTGVKEGVHDTSFELDATVLVPSRNRSSMPGFGSGFFNDDFFGDMFSRYSSKTIHITSEKTAIEVMPLPESSKPDGFSGAIGQFTMKLDAQPTVIDPGEPVTLTMNVAGTGNFAGVEAPMVSDAGGIKAYTPTAAFTPGQSPYSGTKQFQQAIVLTDPSAREIPPVIFSYFDPDAKQYRTLFSDTVDISVNTLTVEEKTSSQPLPEHSVDSPETGRSTGSMPVSLVPVKLEPGTLVERIRPPFLTVRFMAAVLLCVALIAGFFGYQIFSGIQDGNAETVYKKALLAKQKETLNLLDALNPETPDYPAQARKLVGDLLIVQQQCDSVSLTTTDVINRYGNDSVVAELFRTGDKTLYGKQEASSGARQGLHQKTKMFVTKLS